MVADAEDGQNKNLDARLTELDKRLEQFAKERQSQQKPDYISRFDETGKLNHLIRLPAEFGSGVIAGLMLGWGIDSFFDISPWGIVIFTILGFCAGILNLLRATGHIRIKDIKDKEFGLKNEQDR